ncbi:hypothetical protein PSEUDO9AG_30291 [Pseudomonas sp. 9Ag]|nr:hypothetical protein PSEUDO9AG_30291 [Pseudomonas sp. 9Ag]
MTRLAHALLLGLSKINVGLCRIAVCGDDLSRPWGSEPGKNQSEFILLAFFGVCVCLALDTQYVG